jgi:hypothetical protein
VKGSDGGAVEPVEGRPPGSAVRVDGERLADPVAQLAGGLLGERDRGDGLDRHPLVDEGEDPLDQRPGLAGSGPCFDEERRPGVGADPVALGLVRRRRRLHPGSCIYLCPDRGAIRCKNEVELELGHDACSTANQRASRSS